MKRGVEQSMKGGSEDDDGEIVLRIQGANAWKMIGSILRGGLAGGISIAIRGKMDIMFSLGDQVRSRFGMICQE